MVSIVFLLCSLLVVGFCCTNLLFSFVSCLLCLRFARNFLALVFAFNQLIVFAGGVLFLVDALAFSCFLTAPTAVCHHNLPALVILGPRAHGKKSRKHLPEAHAFTSQNFPTLLVAKSNTIYKTL